MNRRTAIRDIIVFAGGVTLLPSCVGNPEAASIQLDKISMTADQENLLGWIVETIIPKTEIPGAREVHAHLFAMKMLDDCYETDVQQKFISGLGALERKTVKRFGNSFADCTRAQREQVLLEVENKGDYSADVFEFYQIMKARTVQGYSTSEYVLKEVKHYTLIPSVKYDGYFPVKNL